MPAKKKKPKEPPQEKTLEEKLSSKRQILLSHSELRQQLEDCGWEFVPKPKVVKKAGSECKAIMRIDIKNKSVRQIFDLVWPREIQSYLKGMINRSMALPIPKVTRRELEQYEGELLLIAVLGLRSNSDLFRNDQKITISFAEKDKAISYDRFKVIHSNLRANRFWLRDHTVQAFQSVRYPTTTVTIDETRFNSASRSERYELLFNRYKPERWALEFATVCDMDNYLYDFTLPKECTPWESVNRFLVVLNRSPHKHHIVMDKHFLTYDQMDQLLNTTNHWYTACMQNKYTPQKLFAKGLAFGLPQWRSRFAQQKGRLIAASYRRSGRLNLLSNRFYLREVASSNANARRPLLDAYDNSKRNVDRFNQLLASYHYRHPHKTVDHNLTLAIFEMACTNAFILYHKEVDPGLSHKDFLEALAMSLINDTP